MQQSRIDNKSFHRSFNSDKNDLYILAFRKSVLEYGMFHQIRVDGEREFFFKPCYSRATQSLKKQSRIIALQTNRV